MSSNNFSLSDQNEVQAVYNQDQEHKSDSDDVVNVGELDIELGLKNTKLHLEIDGLHRELTRALSKSARLEEQNNQQKIRIDEREKFIRETHVVIYPDITIYTKKLFAQYL
ncbi:hypothetical protein BGAL_0025g00340 [Botrytis galanthina]|uniref:Uncharacterized protein n=1 Tax=Botrytis galanthina TaxID=278940 RepID=A0A4S8RLE7_9HELO|nr:hypothetical protein BGAL_0025g00340 [Botrytis galanthina]